MTRLSSLLLLFLSLLSLFSSNPVKSSDKISDYDFKGLQVKKIYNSSGNLRSKLEFYAPTQVPGMNDTYAIKTFYTDYDIDDGTPSSTREAMFLVNCKQETLTTIFLRFVPSKKDLSVLPPQWSALLNQYSSNTIVGVKGLPSKSLRDPAAEWFISDSTAYEVVCNSV